MDLPRQTMDWYADAMRWTRYPAFRGLYVGNNWWWKEGPLLGVPMGLQFLPKGNGAQPIPPRQKKKENSCRSSTGQYLDWWHQIQLDNGPCCWILLGLRTALDIKYQINPSVEDSIRWKWTTSGAYTAKSAYQMQFLGSIPSILANVIWKCWAPSKCKFFTWLLLQNRIWTADRLLQREWPNNYFYQLCFRNLETAHHLFYECPITRTIWDTIATRLGIPQLRPQNWP